MPRFFTFCDTGQRLCAIFKGDRAFHVNLGFGISLALKNCDEQR
jgi:hypothetical protein